MNTLDNHCVPSNQYILANCLSDYPTNCCMSMKWSHIFRLEVANRRCISCGNCTIRCSGVLQHVGNPYGLSSWTEHYPKGWQLPFPLFQPHASDDPRRSKLPQSSWLCRLRRRYLHHLRHQGSTRIDGCRAVIERPPPMWRIQQPSVLRSGCCWKHHSCRRCTAECRSCYDISVRHCIVAQPARRAGAVYQWNSVRFAGGCRSL